MAETLHEIAEREAEEAEQETPDEAQPDGDETETETETEPDEAPPTAATTEAQIDKALAKLETEATRHANTVSKIMGEDASILVPCELCAPNIPGFRFPEPPEQDVQARVLVAIGVGDFDAQAVDPEAETCETCKGYGSLRTGSLVPAQMTRVCPTCGGNGWTNAQQRNAAWSMEAGREALSAPQTTATNGAPPPDSLAPTDAYGRPYGHPCYGMMPQYMTPEQRQLDLPGIHS